MPGLSRTAKEAIKTALAMTVVFGVSMWVPFDRPYWAGFAVAMISLGSAGASLNKGFLRAGGTLLAFVVSLLLFAYFVQERWSFMAASSLFVGWCVYMLGGKKHQYFFQVAAFVTLVIAIDGGSTPSSMFETALTRVEETLLGVVVYALIATFLWPARSGAQLSELRLQLSTTQRDLFRAYQARLLGGSEERGSQELRGKELDLLGKLGTTLDAAVTDTAEVVRERAAWRRFQRLAGETLESLERLRISGALAPLSQLTGPLPGLAGFLAEIEARFVEIVRVTDGMQPSVTPRALDLEVDQQEASRALSRIEGAAVALTRTHLLALDGLTRSLLDVAGRLAGLPGLDRGSVEAPGPAARRLPRLDPDRLSGALLVMAAQWFGFLLWVYVDTPGHQALAQLTPTIGMAMTVVPFARPSMLFRPFLVGVCLMGVAYVFVMPQLSGFLELGTLIFVLVFGICYLYGTPAKGPYKLAALICFLALMDIQNEQTYSFAGFANSAVMIFLSLAALSLLMSLRFTRRPEQAFRRTWMRFCREGERALRSLREGWVSTRARRAPDTSFLQELPAKLGMWSQHVDPAVAGEDGRLKTLADAAQSLSSRLTLLVTTGATAPPAALRGEVEGWHALLEEFLLGWGVGEVAERVPDLQHGLEAVETRLEQLEDGSLGEDERLSFYEQLGSYRSVAEGVVACAGAAVDVPWKRMREPRF